MQGGEGRLVVAGDLQRRGDQEELRALGEEGAAQPLRDLGPVPGQPPVGEVEVLAAGEAQVPGNRIGFRAATVAIGGAKAGTGGFSTTAAGAATGVASTTGRAGTAASAS